VGEEARENVNYTGVDAHLGGVGVVARSKVADNARCGLKDGGGFSRGEDINEERHETRDALTG